MDQYRSQVPVPALDLMQLAEQMYRAAQQQNELVQRQEETIRQLRLQVTALVQENSSLRRMLRASDGGVAVMNGEAGVLPATSAAMMGLEMDVGSRVQRAVSEDNVTRKNR